LSDTLLNNRTDEHQEIAELPNEEMLEKGREIVKEAIGMLRNLRLSDEEEEWSFSSKRM